MSEQDTREKLEADMQNLNGYPTLCKSLANYVAGLLIAKSDEAYKRGYDDGLRANTNAAFAAAKQAFGDIKKWADAANEQRLVAMEQADKVWELTAERDELRGAIDAMENGQFYAMYRKVCEERDALRERLEAITAALHDKPGT